MSTNASTHGNTTCPICGGRGKAVKPVTIESLVEPSACKNLSTTDGFRFCPNPDCDTVYFNATAGATIGKSQVTVRIGQKEADPPRPVCYCFGHTAESIWDEVARTGNSDVFNQISTKCKEGLDRCPQTNPQGSCCLGNVRAAIKQAQTDLGITGKVQDPLPAGCCSAPCDQPADTALESPPTHKVLWASGGAVLTAALTSACCWLPLLLISLGVSTAGVGGFFEAYRPILLGITTALLATGFYLVLKKPRCSPGSACAAPNPRLRKLNIAMLTLATLAVLAFALFPNYLGFFLNSGNTAAASAATQPSQIDSADTPITSSPTYTVHLDVDGMTCAACATGLSAHLNTLPGVQQADVDYDTQSASVQLNSRSDVNEVLEAISNYGYQGKVRRTP